MDYIKTQRETNKLQKEIEKEQRVSVFVTKELLKTSFCMHYMHRCGIFLLNLLVNGKDKFNLFHHSSQKLISLFGVLYVR